MTLLAFVDGQRVMGCALIDYRSKAFSQSGEDGIIARVFNVVGTGNRFCCEFGAWDGVTLSNTRSLIIGGWSALLIEGDRAKFRELQRNYVGASNVALECAYVGTGENSLANILARNGVDRRLDLLSIDIDGLDFNIFAALDQLPALPRLVVVEVQPEHGPFRSRLVPDKLAEESIGQPLAAYVERGAQLGYRLVCYMGANAFFLTEDVGGHAEIPTLSAEDAWSASWPKQFSRTEAEYFYLRNYGLAGPRYKFDNPLLTARTLGITTGRAAVLYLTGSWRRMRRLTRPFRRAVVRRLSKS